MKRFFKYLGIPIVLIGVAILAIPFFMEVHTNRTLVIGLCVIIAGFIYFILAEKHFQ